MLTSRYTPISEEEYLRLEVQSPIRNEYVRGEVFAMMCGTLRHNAIAGNLLAILRDGPHGTACRVFMSDVRVRVEKQGAYYYPDLFVVCSRAGESIDLSTSAVDNPVLLIEVLSTNTEAIDRREKLLAYRTLPSLDEYVLVSQDVQRVEIHRRTGDIGWERAEYSEGDTVQWSSLELSVPIGAIYEGTGR